MRWQDLIFNGNAAVGDSVEIRHIFWRHVDGIANALFRRQVVGDAPKVSDVQRFYPRRLFDEPTTAKALIQGLKHDLLADDLALRALIPQELIRFDDAVRNTLKEEEKLVNSSDWGYDAQDRKSVV